MMIPNLTSFASQMWVKIRIWEDLSEDGRRLDGERK
jgi:hypothetical protein